jgi:hypothetical protein
VPFWEEEASDIQATINGSAAPIKAKLGPDDSLMLLLVLDLAGDLAYADPARTALNDELNKLPHQTWVGLMRAQDGLQALVDPTPDRQPLLETIQNLGISGRAGLLDTIETATDLGDAIQARSHVRLAVLYITDSTVGNYREDFTNPVVNSSDARDLSRKFPEGLINEKIRQLSRRLSQHETPVFIVHLTYRSDRLNEAYQTGLLSLATTTGGSAEVCRTLAEIPDAVSRAFRSITSMQSLTIELKEQKVKQADVVLTSKGRISRYRTRYLLKGK